VQQALRRNVTADPQMLTVELAVRAPFDWPTMLRYLEPRATPGVEAILDGHYWRTIRVDSVRGYIGVSARSRSGLTVHLSPSLGTRGESVLTCLKGLFDTDAPIRRIDRALSVADPRMARLVTRRPGLRVPGAIDRFELAVRAVLGQQVSVRGASTLSGRLAALTGERIAHAPAGLTHCGVSAERLASLTAARIASIGLTRARADCLLALAVASTSGLPMDVSGIKGIGAWTASYIAMRAFHDPDAFPHADIGLRKAAGGVSARQLLASAERWRPWRAYAAMHLWASLADR
jgi:AraC family transcriptional regulator, regulatory protein of adaptative response / DNA-3-methyladenine glycosylase II